MSKSGVILALDAMGGDHGPVVAVEGAAIALKKIASKNLPGLRFVIFGNTREIEPHLARFPELAPVCELVHTDSVVAPQDKPSLALRQGRQSSMRMAIDSVKEGIAAGVVSSGNTGAFMAMAKFVFKTLPGISRPAIAGILPSTHHDILMLDLGANVQCDARDLCGFASMGEAYARTVLGIANPRIGLLNIGSEDVKGREEIQQAAQILKASENMNFCGFVEGDDIMQAVVDVVVTDGFAGNIALKTVEGSASFFYNQLAGALRSSLLGKMGYMLARPALAGLKKRLDPRRYNGAVFLGLNGIAVKSHGGADAYAFSCAIREAYNLVALNLNENITQELARNPERVGGIADASSFNIPHRSVSSNNIVREKILEGAL